ncbi:MAG TPA: hypothetical protein PLI77_05085 [Bacteroidales bacterium]|nr:hypothetical protein [Bacteroidales bacterium]HRW33576.1 hypothetical protein [Thermotogota bacterium]
MVNKQLINETKQLYHEYIAFSTDQSPFLITRLKSKIKLRFRKEFEGQSSDKKKMEKTIEQFIKQTREISWTRINSFVYEEHIDNQMELYRMWMFRICQDLLLLKLITKRKASGMNELYREYSLPIKSYISKNLLGIKGTEYFNNRCTDLMLETFQRFERYATNFNPYKGTLFSYLISIADHLVKDETTIPETLVSDFNEQNEQDTTPIFWAISKDPSPDQIQEKTTQERHFLEQMVAVGGYPWQVLVVLLTKITDERTDITALSDLPLSRLFQEMKTSFSKSSFHDIEELEEIFKPLENQLMLILKDVIPTKDHQSRSYLQDYLDDPLADLSLSVFFGKDPLKNIRDWNHRVLKRLRKKVLES